MMNYDQINPYYAIYRSMNIIANEPNVSKEKAENVARQLGYLHNAFGYVIKDFVKILGSKFNDQPKEKVTNRQTMGNQNSQSRMDIEAEIKPKKPVEARKRASQLMKSKDTAKKSKQTQRKEVPLSQPMETEKEHHFLETFAFGNENIEKNTDQFPKFKQSLSKIINNAVEEQQSIRIMSQSEILPQTHSIPAEVENQTKRIASTIQKQLKKSDESQPFPEIPDLMFDAFTFEATKKTISKGEEKSATPVLQEKQEEQVLRGVSATVSKYFKKDQQPKCIEIISDED